MVESSREIRFPKEFSLPEIEEITIVPIPPVDESIRKPISEANYVPIAKTEPKVMAQPECLSLGIHGQIVCATAEELEVFQKQTSDVLAEYARPFQ